MSLLFNAVSWFVITFLLRSSRLLITWLQSPSAVILEPKKRRSVTTSTFAPCICYEVMGTKYKSNEARCHDLSFSYLIISWLFHSPTSPSSRVSLIPLCFLPLQCYHPHIWGCSFSHLSWFPACNSSSPRMCSTYRLNKLGDSRQPCCTPFSILNQSAVPYRVLTVASWPA